MKSQSINDAFTCKVMNLGESKTPERITLLGDKYKKPEPAQHVIEFPGGAVEVSRTSDGKYWAHIIVNRDFAIDDCKGYRSAIGEIVGTRIDDDSGVRSIPGGDIHQVAILIKTV